MAEQVVEYVFEDTNGAEGETGVRDEAQAELADDSVIEPDDEDSDTRADDSGKIAKKLSSNLSSKTDGLQALGLPRSRS